MRAFLASIRESLLAMAWGLREPRFYVALLLAAVLWSLAYQQKATYTVDVGGPGDDAYVSGFNAKEHNQALDYRWSGAQSTIRFPGIGNEPVVLTVRTVGYRPSGTPPAITVRARGQQFTFQTQPEPYEDSVPVERGPGSDADLTVTIQSPTFSPQGDPRQLGVIVDRVTVSPSGTGLRPFVVPSLATVASMLLAMALAFLTVASTLRARGPGLVVLCGMAFAVGLLILCSRPELGLLGQVAPVVGLWALGLGVLGRALLDSVGIGREAAGWGGLAFAAAFALRFGGTVYPQFLTSDLLLHVHNLQSVLRGQWLFTEPLPDGTPAPYPNALYVLLAPPAAILGRGDANLGLLLKWSGSLLDAATCLALAWAGSRLWGRITGAVAAMAYAFSPGVFEPLSAGNYTNLFAQAVLNCTLLGAIVYLAGRSRVLSGRWGAVLLAAGFMLTMLGHYGVALAALAVAGLFFLWSLWGLITRREGESRAWSVVGAAGAGVLVSFAAYYWHFTGEMWAQWSGLYERLAGTRTGRQASAGPSPGLLDFITRRSVLIGPLPAITATFGGLLGLRNTGRRYILTPYAALLASWLLAALVFAGLDRVVGDTVRWGYLASAAVALLAGRFLARFLTVNGAARLLVLLVFTALIWTTLTYWVGDLIFTRYH